MTTAYVVVADPSNIDRESDDMIAFNVTVTDPKSLGSSTVEITINIIDHNDNSPVFGQPAGYVFQIQETTATMSVVGIVQANDTDATSPNNEITYSIIGNVEAVNVIIDASTGEISINASIDYETMKHYDFAVVATDGASPDSYKRQTAVPVRIDVQDVNDNAPVFSGPFNFSVYEDVAVNTNVFIVTALDADSGNHSKFAFSSQMTSPFSIQASGEIMLTGALDYENQQVYYMTIIANDIGGMATEQNITINVLNVDDHRPIFNQPKGYATSVSESILPLANNVIITVNATDGDLHTFNEVSYQIINPFENIQTSQIFPFQINSTSGEISLAYPVDRETREIYQFIVKASDNGKPTPLTNVVFVNVTVDDDNDNSPIFTLPCYNVTISDATVIGGTVRVVSANDIDAGMNGEVVYSLDDPSGHFSIDNKTGAVYVAQHLYYQTRQSYLLQVMATDSGNPSRNSTSKVAIELSAMKNYPTTVTDTIVFEDSPGMKLTLTDMMLLAHSEIPTYEIEFLNQSDSSSNFRINSTDGCVYVTTGLDYEKSKQHIFLRKAIVNGYVIGEQTIFVNVFDMNDNAPYFAPESKNQCVNISENTEIGQIIAVLRGFDPDESDAEKLTFSVSPVPGFSFGQTSVNGTHILFLTGEIDAEVTQQILLEAFVSDGKNTIFTNLTVKIIDENDNSPMFNASTYVFNKMEGLTADSFVGRVFATDADVSAMYNTIKYRILDAEPQNAFEIFDNGTIVCKSPLDRESIERYEFTVEAYNTERNESRIGVAIVTVNVLDINDNDPICYGPDSYTFPEDEPLGSILFIVNATDADAADNGRLTYALLNNGGLSASLDPVTGALILLGAMDFETTKSYSLEIQITDNGQPQRSLTKFYTINLVDVNDNAPVFNIRPGLKYTKTINENIAIGSSILFPFATDTDSVGNNSQITYSIYEAFGNIPFNISQQGEISTSGPIDREQQDFYQFFISATDNGSPSLSDTILVEITITDENDNDPIFGNLHYNISLAEGTPASFSVLRVSATDKDIGLFGTVCYGLYNQTDSGIFRIDPVTGVLYTTEKIDLAPASYRLIVNTTDKDPSNPRQAQEPVVVDIEVLVASNAIAPQFVTSYATFTIKENDAMNNIGSSLALGDGIKYQVIYDDVRRPYASHFTIAESGAIYLIKSVDFEQVQALSFTVQATNIYNVNATQNIFIKVIDEDDNPPFWLPVNKTQQPIIPVNLSAESRIGQVVTTVAAGDADTVSHEKLKFSLVNDFGGTFDILSYQDVGSIVVKADLRFGSQNYILEVQVEDQAGHKAINKCQINVFIRQPSLPVFSLSVYTFNHLEAQALGVVGSVLATGVPNIRYKILSNAGPVSQLNPFFINEITGEITTTQPLNIEFISQYDLTVVANEKDSSRFAVAKVVVNVAPVNEFAPVFTSPSKYFVSEHIPINSGFIQLHAHDDDKIYKTIRYSFVNSSQSTVQFSVDPITGNATYKGGLNFELQDIVTLTFAAQDDGPNTPKVAYHTVQVCLQNVNEHSPVFTIRNIGGDVYNLQLQENRLAGPVLTVEATDLDKGPAGIVEYSIGDALQVHPFSINRDNGVISLVGPINREAKDYYELLVIATDKGTEPRSDAILVVIQISDLNDNRPIFNPQVYRLIISDNTPVGRTLAPVYATDADLPPNNVITYSITGGSGFDHFGINSTSGEIFLKKAIDYRNVLERAFILVISASDAPSFFSPIPASVFIEVVQSEIPKAPYFVQPQYVATIDEDINPQQLFIIQAVNPTGDALTFKVVNNTLIPDEDNFAAALSSGNLFLIKKVDYEKQQRHDFEMRASCTTTGMTGIATFTIYVSDVNDNRPYFIQPRAKTVYANEKSNIGQEVTRIHVADPDSINRGKMFLRINTPNVPFSITNAGDYGVVYVNSDLESLTQSVYRMEITVFDKDSNGDLQNEALEKYYLTVNVTRNDKRYPQFNFPVYNQIIPENKSPTPYLVADVFATLNPIYKLLNAKSNDYFINPDGKIYARRSFDAETDQNCEFTVAATNPVNNFTSYAAVNVIIQDLNDNVPTFVGPFSYNVSESTALGSFLFHANVRDADVTVQPKRFKLISVTPQVALTLNEDTGYVYLGNALDYETSPKHVVVIEAVDGALTSRQTYTLNVINVNEHDPAFGKQYYRVSVIENEASPLSLLSMPALDRDAGLFGEITYRIDSNNASLPFAVSTRGQLFLTGHIDYEFKHEYNFVVVASDKGSPSRTGFARVTVEIIDGNDNVPYFDYSIYNTSVVEIAPIGTSLITVHATDRDTAPHAVVEYQIAQDAAGLFRVDPATGILSTKGNLDYEVSAYHEVTLRAIDKEKPNLNTASITLVKIRVLDANEHQPTFSVPTKTISIVENTVSGRSIGETRAEDIDTTFRTIKYSIEPATNTMFRIAETSGVIFLEGSVDYETKKSHAFVVVATDNGGLKGRQTIVVNILDDNDNAPSFDNMINQTYIISKNVSPAQTIAVLHATDRDVVSQTKLQMRIDNNVPFEILMNGNAGYISVRDGADLGLGVYVVEVSVSDGRFSSPQRAFVTITVKYPPGVLIAFRQQHGYAFNVNENSINHIFGAVDATVTNNVAPISYRIFETSSPFKISTNGLLSQNGVYDYEAVPSYLIHVIGSVTYDGVTYATTTSVYIKINDVNDESPVFTGSVSVSIPEDTLVGTAVLTVTATDSDAPGSPNSQLVYSLSGSNKFAVDANTGVISLLQAVDYESERLHRVNVTAYDRGQPVKGNSQVYTINIINVNDNHPSFPQKLIKASVLEDADTNNRIVCAVAADADNLGPLQYELVPDEASKFFAAGRSTGCIFYTGPKNGLDREKETSYEFLLMATDSGTPTLSGYTTVVIEVIDTNDNTPLFANSLYNLQLSEKTNIGTEIIRLVATDIDEGDNGKVTLSISSGNLGNAFQLTGDGTLKTASNLNLNTTPDKFTLVVRAQDSGAIPRSSSVTVNIDIIDSTVFVSPTFTQAVYTVNITEAQSANIAILRVQASYANVAIGYEILDSSILTAGKIAINTNGDIRLLQRLDFEEIQYVGFLVKAFDSNNPNNGYSTALVRIFISDVNDNRPVFKRSFYQTSLARDSKVGAVVANVLAIDADSGSNAIVRYAFAPNSLSTIFNVNAVNGEVTLKRVLQKADIKNYKMEIIASDTGVPQQTSTISATVNVNIYPDNMFKPVITNTESLLSITIPETQAQNSVIATVQASDEDAELPPTAIAERPEANNFGRVTFSILQREFLPFSVGSGDGVIRLTGTVDRETKPTYEFYVQARDGGTPFRSTTARVRITVSDLNEAPRFVPQSYSATVSEATPRGISILRVTAVDEDSTANANVQYSIRSGNTGNIFRIDSSSGVISLGDFLDFETAEKHVITVRATDGKLNTSPDATITITVADVDENPNVKSRPVFDNTLYSYNIPESVTTSTLGNVRATGESVTYSKPSNSGDNALFTITPDGRLSFSSGDYETKREYVGLIRATSANDPERISDASVLVILTDINDNTPVISNPSASVSIKEDAPPNTHVYTVYATDRDSGNNGKLLYSFDTATSTFSIETSDNTGIIRLRTLVDRELTNSYSLRIKVEDSGNPVRSVFQSLTVNIDDQNDNNPAPKVIGQTSATVEVDQQVAINTLVYTVRYEDTDSGLNGQVEYVLANPSDKFNLGLTDGRVITKATMGSAISEYYLFIIARDKGTPSRKSSFTLKVMVKFATPPGGIPAFSPSSYIFQADEGTRVNSIIGHLNVLDTDLSDSYTYTIKSGNTNNAFVVTSAGNVQVNTPLDRESVASYSLSIGVVDSRSNAAALDATVVIEVTDINDNNPAFTQGSYAFSILENYVVGNGIAGPFPFTVQATDADKDLNAKLIYKVIDASETFKINNDGKLYLNKALDYANKNQYDLIVVAEDQGTPKRASTIPLTITVTDVNEKPVFSSSTYIASVNEVAAIGTSIISLSIVDDDSAPNNNQITLNILNGNNQNHFRVQGNEIILNGLLDYESINTYTLTVTALDNGSPRLKADPSATITIKVLPVNDNQPTFNNQLYTGEINEAFISTVAIVTVEATDSDQRGGVGGAITYSLDGSTDAQSFNILLENGKGKIYNRRNLDFETQSQYSFNVIAQDNDRSSLSTKALVVIKVKDTNDNRPVFQSNTYNFTVDDESVVGTILGRVLATDQDTGDNAQVEYFFSAGETASFDMQDNLLVLKNKVDFTRKSLYTFTVGARDKQSTLVAQEGAVVRVTVKPTQGSVPVFEKLFYNVTVVDNVTIADIIITVKATDPDGPNFSSVSYSLVESSDSKYFQVDSATGVVRLNAGQTLSAKNQIRHVLIVNAVDNVGLSSQTYIIVHVLGKNISAVLPTFEVTDYFGVATDKMDADTSIVRVFATGPDRTTYNIESGNTDDLFVLSEFGTLLLKRAFIYNSNRPTNYTLIVRALGDNSLQSAETAKIFIQLHYISGDSPVFNATEYSGSIPESSNPGDAYILTVSASFGNVNNGSIAYRLIYNTQVKDTHFVIDESSGRINGIWDFDREMKSEYVFEVEAFNKIQASSKDKALVTVTITDSNDNEPSFGISGLIDASVVENAPANTEVICIKATDADSGVNGEIIYSLVSDLGLFKIDAATGVIRTQKPIDYETNGPAITIQVRASDKATPSKSATARVNVVIDNMNDVRPKFGNASYSATITESTSQIPSILKVEAQETDLDFGPIKFAIVIEDPTSIPFIINELTGVLGTNKAVDYEAKTSYELCVKAFDSGTPSLSELVTVTINVIDANDNSPVADEASYRASISEGAQVGALVIIVKATDLDSGVNGQITYSISSGNVGNTFQINSATGEIQVLKQFDRETTPQYNLKIGAKDNAPIAEQKSLANSIEVIIDVLDVNDEIPVVTVGQSLQIQEGPAGRFVENSEITVTDGDPGDVTTLSLQNHNDKFEISGKQIKTKDALNYDTHHSYELVIKATDTGRHVGLATTTVTIQNQDNTPPVFPADANYDITVPENQPVNSIVAVYIATDPNSGENGRVSYSITQDSSNGKFLYSDGILTLAAPLDHEGTKTYDLTLKAEDGGSPKKDSTTNLKIHVANANDDPPSFNSAAYSGSLNANDGVSITTSASDIDGDALTYSIVTNSVSNLFQISASGLITNKSPLSRNVDKYNFNIQVSDGVHIGLAQVLINVGGVGSCTGNNNRTGTITMESLNLQLDENFDISTAFATVNATITGDIGVPVYSIKDDSSKFRVDSSSGEVFAKSDFDFEMNQALSVCVVAKGSLNNAISVTSTVNIDIRNVNDVEPVFAAGLATYTLDSAQIAQPFAAIVASTPGNYQVTYAIQSGNTGNAFTIDASSGALKLSQVATQSADFTLTIRATSGTLFTDQAVSVRVNKVPDRPTPPTFEASNYPAILSENVAIGTDVVTVVVNGAITPTFVVLDNLLFNVSSTGVVKVQRRLDYETAPSHTFAIKVTDANTGFIAVTTVTVTVVNFDEEKPSFSGKFTASIPSSWPVQITILDATALQGANVKYTLVNDPPIPGFAIDIDSGGIRLTESKAPGIYTLSVKGENSFGNDTTEAIITVNSGGFSFAPLQGQSSPAPGQLEIAVDGAEYFGDSWGRVRRVDVFPEESKIEGGMCSFCF